MIRRGFKSVAVLAILGLLGLAGFLGSLWLEHRVDITLPAPTGPFAVGRVIYAWTDDAHIDALAPVPNTKRQLVVWIWYPAAAGPSAVVDDYLPAAWRAAIKQDRGGLNSKFLTRDLSKVHAHSIRDADVTPQQPSYPVVIMRGGGSSEVANYTTLAEDLASHGYVVVGFDAPYRTNEVVFPDGRVMRRLPRNNPEFCEGQPDLESCADRIMSAWVADIGFVLDRLAQLNNEPGVFAGRLDMTRVGVFGHSFGGASAMQFCHDDTRCKAGINIDGQPFGSVVQEGIHQPFMFLLSDGIQATDPDTRRIAGRIQSIYDTVPKDARLRVMIRGANHFLFTDDGALLKSHIVMRTLRMLGLVGIDGRRQLAITVYCVHRFFDAYLKATTVSRLNISSPLYPEIQVIE